MSALSFCLEILRASCLLLLTSISFCFLSGGTWLVCNLKKTLPVGAIASGCTALVTLVVGIMGSVVAVARRSPLVALCLHLGGLIGSIGGIIVCYWDRLGWVVYPLPLFLGLPYEWLYAWMLGKFARDAEVQELQRLLSSFLPAMWVKLVTMGKEQQGGAEQQPADEENINEGNVFSSLNSLHKVSECLQPVWNYKYRGYHQVPLEGDLIADSVETL